MLGTITKSCHLINDELYIRLPIRMRLLDEILFELERYFGANQPYLEKLYKSAFSLAYYGMMRIGELSSGSHPVLAKDVHIARHKNKILLMLHTLKTHDESDHPQKIKIQALDEHKVKQKLFCPFQLTIDYMCIHGIYETEKQNRFSSSPTDHLSLQCN